jgi:hypothetical protein
MRSTVKAFDPFNLSTFHCLDWRGQGSQSGRIMTDEKSPLSLSAELVRARGLLHKAAEKHALAKARSEHLESEAHRLSATLDSLTSMVVNFGEGGIPESRRRASEEAADRLARAISSARLAAVELVTVTAEVEGLTKEADLVLEALVVSVQH